MLRVFKKTFIKKGEKRDECFATYCRGRPPCLPELRPTNSLRTLYSPPITPKTSVALRGDIFGYKSLQNRADTGVCPYAWRDVVNGERKVQQRDSSRPYIKKTMRLG